jgi:hypothetical protein
MNAKSKPSVLDSARLLTPAMLPVRAAVIRLELHKKALQQSKNRNPFDFE